MMSVYTTVYEWRAFIEKHGLKSLTDRAVRQLASVSPPVSECVLNDFHLKHTVCLIAPIVTPRKGTVQLSCQNCGNLCKNKK